MSRTPHPIVTLRAGRDRSVTRRHPWVFSGGIEAVEGRPGRGDTVLVEDDAGRPLGWGAYSPESQIRVRMWSFSPDDVIDAAFVDARITRAAARRDALLASGTDSARLVFSEADGVPGVVRTLYDPTGGTGGMLSVGEEQLLALNPLARLVMYGQALNSERARDGLKDLLLNLTNL